METNPFSLKGKKVLVTGASSGIGRAIAIELSKAGASVYANGRSESKLTETMHQLFEGEHFAICSDLTVSTSVSDLANDIPPLDGIVHCAGINKRLPLKMISEKSVHEMMQINLFAPILLTRQLYAQKKLTRGASIVFVSSIASNYASLGNILYMTSKGALDSFMKGVAFELAGQDIRLNSIQPGMIKTQLSSAINDETIAEDIKKYPLGRYGRPEEVAFAAIYLLSDATQWMTGSILTLDGGLTLQ